MLSKQKIVFALSSPLVILIIISSRTGLLTPNFYSKETLNWITQSVAQDAVNLFLIVPLLIITLALIARQSRFAFFIWGGINLYLLYTFVIYCFDIHFNKLFLIYCFILGLSFYSFIYFLSSRFETSVNKKNFDKPVVKIDAIYFMVIALLFYFLWLSEILSAVFYNNTPKDLLETGLFTNPVKVIDLSIILPAIFVAGIFLLRRKSIGIFLAPVMLVFFILMDITIAFLNILMKIRNATGGYAISILMGALVLFSLLLLTWYLKAFKFLTNKISDEDSSIQQP
jgi:hypothetical protein